MALEKIMNRCFKLYNMIDGFMKVFKLIGLKQKLELSADLEDQGVERKRQVLIKRISVAIVLLIKENPILPVSFKFEGQCLLESLKAERDAHKQKRANDQNVETKSREEPPPAIELKEASPGVFVRQSRD
jgi:hypothetical protein